MNLTTTDGDIPEDVVAGCLLRRMRRTAGAFQPWDRPMARFPRTRLQAKSPRACVVLGYKFWQRYYTGDPAVVGRTIAARRKNYEIIGVTPPRFRWRKADVTCR